MGIGASHGCMRDMCDKNSFILHNPREMWDVQGPQGRGRGGHHGGQMGGETAKRNIIEKKINFFF